MKHRVGRVEVSAVVAQIDDVRGERDGTGQVRARHGFAGGKHDGQEAS